MQTTGDNPPRLANGAFTRALVRPPGATFADGLTTSALGTPDLELVLLQHARYCEALMECGLRVQTLPAESRFPDGTFVEDTAVITPRGAILARPGAEGRREEVSDIAAALADDFPQLARIVPPGTLDGGDVCPVEDRYFIGLSRRTNADGARQLADWLAAGGYSSTLVEVTPGMGLLHLKTGLTWLGDGRLLVCEALAAVPEFRRYEQVRVPSGEEYAANCLPLGGRVLIPAGFPATERRLQVLGYATLSLDMSEFRKMDGGLTCLSLRF
jgi:dimethylargininase